MAVLVALLSLAFYMSVYYCKKMASLLVFESDVACTVVYWSGVELVFVLVGCCSVRMDR